MAKESVGPGGRGVSYRREKTSTGRDLGTPTSARSGAASKRTVRKADARDVLKG